MKWFGAKGQASSALFADGTAAGRRHRAGDRTAGCPGAARLRNEHPTYRTRPPCRCLLPLRHVVPDARQL